MAITESQVTAFMAPVVEKAAKYIQLLDEATKDPAIDDVVLCCAADLAYGQVAGFTNRDFVKSTFVDRYYKVPKKLEVRCLPLVSVSEVKYEDVVLVEGSDYTIDGNYLVFCAVGTGLFKYGEDLCSLPDYLYSELKVTYEGGIVTANLNHLLLSALIFQTVANYRRSSVLGLSKILLAGPTAHSADVSSDRGRIVDAASDILDKLVYYGDYEECC